jgi:hypothetical protein
MFMSFPYKNYTHFRLLAFKFEFNNECTVLRSTGYKIRSNVSFHYF